MLKVCTISVILANNIDAAPCRAPGKTFVILEDHSITFNLSQTDFQVCGFNRLSNIRYAWTSYHIHLIHFLSFYTLIHHNQLRSPITDSARGVHLRYFCLAHSVISSSLPLHLNIGLVMIRGWSPFILMGLFQFTQKNLLYIYKWASSKDSAVGPMSFSFFLFWPCKKSVRFWFCTNSR